MISLNTFSFSPYEFGLDFISLLGFTIGSFIVISILGFYYNRIPKNTHSINKLENPIYQSKDFLFQSNSTDSNLIITKSTSSTFVKIIVFILISFVVFIPVDQLFSVVNSFY
jgi:hypothetical protein